MIMNYFRDVVGLKGNEDVFSWLDSSEYQSCIVHLHILL